MVTYTSEIFDQIADNLNLSTNAEYEIKKILKSLDDMVVVDDIELDIEEEE